jgi:hypothetical protein
MPTKMIVSLLRAFARQSDSEGVFSAAGLGAVAEIWRRLKMEICDPYRIAALVR